MKANIFITLALVLSGTTLMGAGVPDLKCREMLPAHAYASEKARIAADLTQGAWVLKADRIGNKTGDLYFYDFGIADEIIRAENGTLEYERLHWTIELYNGAHFLVITHLNDASRTNLYRITYTCDGITLVDAGNFEHLLLYHHTVNSSLRAKRAHYMTGAWVATAYPFDITNDMDACGTFSQMPDAHLQVTFWQDGTYARSWGHAGRTFTEKGYWDIAPDGQYLLLHKLIDDDHSATDGTTAIAIKNMEDGLIQIEMALHHVDDAHIFCTEWKTFTFRRW